MRDLSTQELSFVYGAGDSPMPPSRSPRCKKAKKGGSSSKGHAKRNKGGSSSKGHGKRNRCGKGGSS